VTTPAGTDTIQLPSADLGWTVAPHFELGYRIPGGLGELVASYHFVEADGSGSIANFDAAGNPAALRSRLDLNDFGFDYASREFPLAMGPGWDMKWLIGVRVSEVYFDSTAVAPGLAQHFSNHFDGAGPHIGVELWRHLGTSGLSLYGRTDVTFLFGSVHQTFSETFPAGGGASEVSRNQGVPVLTFQGGLGWTPPGIDGLRFAAGYEWERWYHVAFDGDSRGEVWIQGVFLRAEWHY
jgi:hypothetical protein